MENENTSTPNTTTNAHIKRDHARLGGSSAHRWHKCTASISLIESLPPQGSSSAADLGTFAHEIAEKKIKAFLDHKINGTSTDLNELLKDDLEKAHKTFESSLVEKADMSTDLYVQAIWKQVLDHSITGKVYGLEDEFTVNEDLSMFGFVDFWAIYISDASKRVGVVVDYKNGYTSVPIKGNAQLAFYALGLLKFVQSKGKDLDLIRTVIFQPNSSDATNSGSANKIPGFKEAILTKKQVLAWEKKFLKAAKEILVTKKVKYVTGDHCKFCPGQPVCPAYLNSLSSSTALDLKNVASIKLPAPETLDENTLTSFIIHADELSDYIESVKKYVLSLMQVGKPVKGLKLIEGPTKRCWRDNEEEIATNLIAMGVTNPWNKKLLGITAAEKLIGKGKLGDLCTTTVARQIVVPQSDPRPEIKSCDANSFKVLSD